MSCAGYLIQYLYEKEREKKWEAYEARVRLTMQAHKEYHEELDRRCRGREAAAALAPE